MSVLLNRPEARNAIDQEMAYACDLRLGTPSTKIGNPETGRAIEA